MSPIVSPRFSGRSVIRYHPAKGNRRSGRANPQVVTWLAYAMNRQFALWRGIQEREFMFRKVGFHGSTEHEPSFPTERSRRVVFAPVPFAWPVSLRYRHGLVSCQTSSLKNIPRRQRPAQGRALCPHSAVVAGRKTSFIPTSLQRLAAQGGGLGIASLIPFPKLFINRRRGAFRTAARCHCHFGLPPCSRLLGSIGHVRTRTPIFLPANFFVIFSAGKSGRSGRSPSSDTAQASASLQYCTHLATSFTASEPSGILYSSSMSAGNVHFSFFIN